MHDSLVALLDDAGIRVGRSARGYRPTVSLPGFEAKILKPQNIVEMLAEGSRDLGFAGADWATEMKADLVEVLDTRLDPVRIVAAAPREILIRTADGWRLPTRAELGRPLRVASELEGLSTAWIAREQLDARFVRTFGATEVFPPEDADCIVDVTQTGATLEANGLEIVGEVMRSSTRLFASRAAWADPAKRAAIEDLRLLLTSVLEARGRVMLEINAADDASLERLVDILPCMRRPTVSRLFGDDGYAVKAAVKRDQLPTLIPRIKQAGGTDIVISRIEQVVP
jgi:ATP phosphoribosyltransferase